MRSSSSRLASAHAASLALSVALLAAPRPLPTAPALALPDGAQPRTEQDVLRAMHDKYSGAWYPTVSFVQNVVYTDGRPAQDMWEALKIPAKLRIDIGPIDAPPRTIIFRDEMRYVFDKGKLTSTTRAPNLLLVLGFDVYGQPPEKTAAVVEGEGFDLSKVREDTWEGKAAWVVGAAAGDTTGNQFWIEKERLLFLRLVQKTKAGDLSDIRFTKYEPLGRGWIGTVVVFFTNGKETFREIYRDWRIDPAVTDALFETDSWHAPAWAR